MNKGYVLEVVKFITDKNGDDGWLANDGKEQHIGYMKAKFRTKKDACSYYDRNNPHMRSLNAHGTYRSDWDLETQLRYIVREDHHLNDSIPPFVESDMPIIDKSNGGIRYEYKWLK